MAEPDIAMLECGFCLRKNEAIEEPKLLPCTHVHCSACLTGSYETNGVLQCPPPCGKIVEGKINSLPSPNTPASITSECDTCTARGDNNQATVYCIQCDSKYCLTHQKSHDDLHVGHKKMSLTEYERKAESMKVRQCEVHKGHPYSLGCRVCLLLVCTKCFPLPAGCAGATEMAHDMQPLDVLVQEIIEDNFRDQMVGKEKELDQQHKVLSKANENYDEETTCMVERLNSQRKAQVQAINEKYDQLERDLVEKRKNKKEEMLEIMEEHVLKMWTTLKNQRLKLESKLESSHQVDLLRGYRELKEDAKKTMDIKLPELKLVELVKLDECRDVEIKLTPAAEDLRLECLSAVEKREVSVKQARSLSLRLEAETSLCCYRDEVYVGLSDNTVARIDSKYQTIISKPREGSLLAVSVDANYICTLSYHAEVPAASAFVKPTPNRHEVCHYSHPFPCGELMGSYDASRKWTYSTGQPCGELDMCVTSGYLTITDRVHNTITARQISHNYSRVTFNAQHKKINFSGIYVAQCASDANSIILMTRDDLNRLATVRVSQVDLPTGNSIWTYVHDSCGPQLLASTVSADGRLLIASKQFKVMIQLDIKTGKKLCELVSTDTGTRQAPSDSAGKPCMKGLVSANNLLVTVESGKIQYYEIKSV